MVVLSRTDLYDHIHDLVIALTTAGWLVTIRAGEASDQGRLDGVESRLPVGVMFSTTPALRSRGSKVRFRLLLLAGWGVYVRSGDAESRYFERLSKALAADPVLRRILPALQMGRSRPLLGRYVLSLCRLLGRFVPLHEDVAIDVRRELPDLLIVAGRNYPASSKKDDPAPEYLEAARRAGIPTAAVVLTWDNLTTKGTFLTRPDRVLAWNTFHQREAVRRHGLRRDRISVVGSTRFEAMAQAVQVGRGQLPGGRSGARILYLGSSANIARDEVPVVRAICADLRSRRLDVDVMVRPHPANYRPFLKLREPNAFIWPPQEQNDLAEKGLASFRAALQGSLLVAGINTSGFLDAAVLGSRVLALSHLDRDLRGEPSRHLRAMLQFGVANEARDVGHLVDHIESALQLGPQGSDSTAVAAAVLGPRAAPARAILDTLHRLIGLDGEALP